jgi:hypothetical protein
MVQNNNDAIEFHTVPHARCALKAQLAEVIDSIEDVVSPEGIEPARPRPEAEGRVTDVFRGETN